MRSMSPKTPLADRSTPPVNRCWLFICKRRSQRELSGRRRSDAISSILSVCLRGANRGGGGRSGTGQNTQHTSHARSPFEIRGCIRTEQCCNLPCEKREHVEERKKSTRGTGKQTLAMLMHPCATPYTLHVFSPSVFRPVCRTTAGPVGNAPPDI